MGALNEKFDNILISSDKHGYEVTLTEIMRFQVIIVKMLYRLAHFLDENIDRMGLPKVGTHPDEKTENPL